MQVVNIQPELSQQVIETVTTSAYVVSEDSGVLTLGMNGVVFNATRAVGCLVKPAVGDKVLCCIDSTDSNYVLSVLESQSKETTHVSVDNDLVIESRGHNLDFISAHNVNLASGNQLNLLAKDTIISSEKGLFQISELSLFSKTTTAHLTNGRVCAKQLETVSDTITQRFINSFRFVEKLDHIKAGNVMQSVKNLFTLRSRQAVVLADQDVRIDGERIHMG